MESNASENGIYSFTAKLSGKRVDFGKPGVENGLAWGIEVKIPIDNVYTREKIKFGTGIDIPPHIKNVIYLELAPQESLPAEQRTIRSAKPDYMPSFLNDLTEVEIHKPLTEKLMHAMHIVRETDKKRVGTLVRLLHDVIGSNDKNIEKINDILRESPADSLVLVRSHSFNKQLGEAYMDKVADQDGNVIQKESNNVNIDDVVALYNDRTKYASVLFHTCYLDEPRLEAQPGEVPVVRAIGNVGGIKSIMGINRTMIFMPSQQ